jgi:hypothetical protein
MVEMVFSCDSHFGCYCRLLLCCGLNGPIEPMGRLAFVKLLNPDMYPGHPHSVLLAQEAEATGSTPHVFQRNS